MFLFGTLNILDSTATKTNDSLNPNTCNWLHSVYSTEALQNAQIILLVYTNHLHLYIMDMLGLAVDHVSIMLSKRFSCSELNLQII